MAHTNPRLPFPAACCPVNSWLPHPFHFMFHSSHQNMNASCVITRAVVSPNQPHSQVQRGFWAPTSVFWKSWRKAKEHHPSLYQIFLPTIPTEGVWTQVRVGTGRAAKTSHHVPGVAQLRFLIIPLEQSGIKSSISQRQPSRTIVLRFPAAGLHLLT